MTFEPLSIPGVVAVAIEPHADERGFFARQWCSDEFAAQGIVVDMVQASVSRNRLAGTLRGMHYTVAPSTEGKLVRCGRGRIHDVVIDLRPESPGYLSHLAVELDAEQQNALWIPPGLAHGFQTLADDTDVVYLMSERYRPELARGVRFDDPAFGIRWPRPVSVIAERDRQYPDFRAGR